MGRLLLVDPTLPNITIEEMIKETYAPLEHNKLTSACVIHKTRIDAERLGRSATLHLSDGSTLTLEEPFTQKALGDGYPPLVYAGLASLDNASPSSFVIKQAHDVGWYLTRVLPNRRRTVAIWPRPVFSTQTHEMLDRR
jgi:hypothetical protein